MRLSELDACFYGERIDGIERHGTGITFECPHCALAGIKPEDREHLGISFQNPLDGGMPGDSMNKNRKSHWKRTGDTIETLTIHPSIDASGSGHWHGFIINGEIK